METSPTSSSTPNPQPLMLPPYQQSHGDMYPPALPIAGLYSYHWQSSTDVNFAPMPPFHGQAYGGFNIMPQGFASTGSNYVSGTNLIGTSNTNSLNDIDHPIYISDSPEHMPNDPDLVPNGTVLGTFNGVTSNAHSNYLSNGLNFVPNSLVYDDSTNYEFFDHNYFPSGSNNMSFVPPTVTNLNYSPPLPDSSNVVSPIYILESSDFNDTTPHASSFSLTAVSDSLFAESNGSMTPINIFDSPEPNDLSYVYNSPENDSHFPNQESSDPTFHYLDPLGVSTGIDQWEPSNMTLDDIATYFDSSLASNWPMNG